jgi:pyruvate dehydrogenase E1 component alpha subunit
LESWKQRDPITTLRERAVSKKVADNAAFDRIDSEVAAWLADAVEFASNSKEPEAASVFEYV